MRQRVGCLRSGVMVTGPSETLAPDRSLAIASVNCRWSSTGHPAKADRQSRITRQPISCGQLPSTMTSGAAPAAACCAAQSSASCALPSKAAERASATGSSHSASRICFRRRARSKRISRFEGSSATATPVRAQISTRLLCRQSRSGLKTRPLRARIAANPATPLARFKRISSVSA